jgi:hypothetical protein
VIRPLAANVAASSIRFSAAHRVNFDAPPLKWLRLELFRFLLETHSRIGTYVRSKTRTVPFATLVTSVNGR